MDYKIRLMEEDDRSEVLCMMRSFYTSPAVLTDGSEEIYSADIDNCVSDSPYLEGYIFEGESDILGYAMVAKSFSTEFGRACIWIEDIYLKEEYRNQGIGSGFFRFIENKYPGAIFRLEAEEENERAIHVYEKAGFDVLPYVEMIKL